MSKRKPAQIHGILVIDKPLGFTSRAVVNKLAWLLGDKRCGHAGTLDPQASGVLLVAFGEATKCVRWLMDAEKTYETTIIFGSATDSDDASGQVIAQLPVPKYDRATIENLLAKPGWIQQIPPAVSALQKDGVRDYERVRRGEIIEREAREVWLGDVQISDLTQNTVKLHITCGAGFYVRSLARDLGQALGTLAHVGGLRRTAAGGLDLDIAHSLMEIEALPVDDRRALLLPIEAVLLRLLPHLTVDDEVSLQLRHGKLPDIVGEPQLPSVLPKPAHSDGQEEPQNILIVDQAGRAVCIAQGLEGKLKVVRGFVDRAGANQLTEERLPTLHIAGEFCVDNGGNGR